MKELLNRLSSRKFLLAVSAAAGLLANKQYGLAVTVVLGYFGINKLDS